MPIPIDSGLCLSLRQPFPSARTEFGLLSKEGGHGVFLYIILIELGGIGTKTRLSKQMGWITWSVTGLAGRTDSLLRNDRVSSSTSQCPLQRKRSGRLRTCYEEYSCAGGGDSCLLERSIDNEIDLIIEDF